MRTALLFIALVSFARAATLNLSWSDNSNNETRFEIQRSTDAENFTTITTTAANATTYADTTIVVGTTYYYRVRAVNSSGASAWSDTVSGVLAAGANVVVVNVTVGTLVLP